VPDTWITDARHSIGWEGAERRVPGPAINLALFLRGIVEWMSSRPISGVEFTNVFCRRNPGRARCAGRIEAYFVREPEGIAWRCPRCGDNGLIHGWEGTAWDRREAHPRS
jgi:hypothetical protein